jgi:hypothetical protein
MTIPVDHSKEIWSGFFKNEDEAQANLDKRINLLVSKGKRIVSAKKELIERKKTNDIVFKLKENQKSTVTTTKNLQLYRFVIITG